jgi:hypothetical protein
MPVTCGAAIDVPSHAANPSAGKDEAIATPRAQTSISGRKQLNFAGKKPSALSKPSSNTANARLSSRSPP